MRKNKLFIKILTSQNYVQFHDMILLIESFGLRLSRHNGSHFIFVHPGIPELVNIQDVQGKAKPYQIRQFLQIVE